MTMDDMTAREIASALCLSVVAVLATLAVFCRNYHENWAQFVGLVGIAIWSAARVSQLTDALGTRLPAQSLVLHASLACYALGTAWKVWLHRPHNNGGGDTLPMEAPYKLENDQMRQVAGGKK